MNYLFILRHYLYLLTVFIFLSTSVDAQVRNTGSITGQVKDSFGASIFNAEVTLFFESHVFLKRLQTDNEGQFTFTNLDDTDYILAINKPGFGELRQVVKPEQNSKQITQFKLNVSTITEDVTVTAVRGEAQNVFDTTESVSIASSFEIGQRLTSLLPLALREEPGIHIQQTTTSQGSPFIRGLTGQQVLNLINGVRFNNSTFRPGANQYTALIDPLLVEQIEIVRGPSSTQYGTDSLGGTINVLTHWGRSGVKKFELHGGFDVLFGSADLSAGVGARLSGGASRWGFAGELTGRRVQDLRTGGGIDSHSVVTRLFGISSKVLGNKLQDTAYTQYGGNGKFVFQPTERDNFSFEYLRGTQLGVRRYDQLNGGLGNLINDFNPQVLDFFTARYDRAGLGFLDTLSATFSFNGQRDDRTSQSVNNTSGGLRSKITDEYNRTDVFGYQLQGTTHIGRNHSLSFGTEFYNEYITSRRTDFSYNNSTAGFTNAVNVRARFPDGSRYQTFGVYLQDTATIIPNKLNATFGIRYSNFRYSQSAVNNPLDSRGQPTVPDFKTSFGDVTYNAGLVYTVNKYINLAGNFSRGFRAPNVNDFGSIGLSGIGFEISPEEGARLNGTIGNFDPAIRPTTGKPIKQLIAEQLLSYEVSVRLRTSRINGSLTLFNSEISNFIERRTIILAPGAVGQTIGGQTITRQDAAGSVYTALSNSPVFVRTNAGRLRLRGWEAQLSAKIFDGITLNGNVFSIRGTDLDRNVAPALENGVPPATGFASVKWEPQGKRFWVEAYSNFADAQRRFSDNDLQQARIGGIRTRAEIANFFNNGAVARGLVRNGVLLETGETLPQVQNRVLGAATRAPLFTKNPGFATFSVRGGYRFGESSALTFILENIFDKNYRTMGSGVDAPGINAMVRYSYKF
ncbi:MAG: TonB-dependent receptor [Acidobacteriota bacterium]|nr:TonB-dependent receptor [Acidobacteriota bacterium]